MPADDLLRGLAQRYSQVANCTIDFVVQEELIHGIKPHRSEVGPFELGDKRLGFPWMKVVIRIDGPRRYQRIEAPKAGLWDAPLQNFNGPFTRQALSWNGNIGMRYNEVGMTGYIVGTLENPVLENQVYRLLDWPVSEVNLRERDHTFLPDSIDGTRAAVLPDQEIIEGHHCHVLEVPGLDRLWIDVSEGFALIKREIRFSKNGPLRQVLLTGNWQEVGKNA